MLTGREKKICCYSIPAQILCLFFVVVSWCNAAAAHAGLMILAKNFPKSYVAVPIAEQIGRRGVFGLWTLSLEHD